MNMTQDIAFSPAARIAVIALSGALMLPLASAQTPAKPAAMQSGMAANSTMAAGDMDMKAMMKDMNDKMASMQMSGNADVDFAMLMRIHHKGAIDMAKAELRDGKDLQMHKMAKGIIAAQEKEIAQFDKFLAKKGKAAGTTGT
jgi:uncharacterized protein (DUF305 family)